jgi:hypothetical protein
VNANDDSEDFGARERWFTKDMAEFRTASLSAGMCLPLLNSRRMKSWASSTDGDCGKLGEVVDDAGEACSSCRRLLFCAGAVSVSLRRFDELRACRSTVVVRVHCMLPSIQLPHGSLRSHFTFSDC